MRRRYLTFIHQLSTFVDTLYSKGYIWVSLLNGVVDFAVKNSY
jgi:hypothetical protein